MANLINTLQLLTTNIESFSRQFSNQYDASVVIYDRRAFIRSTTVPKVDGCVNLRDISTCNSSRNCHKDLNILR